MESYLLLLKVSVLNLLCTSLIPFHSCPSDNQMNTRCKYYEGWWHSHQLPESNEKHHIQNSVPYDTCKQMQSSIFPFIWNHVTLRRVKGPELLVIVLDSITEMYCGFMDKHRKFHARLHQQNVRLFTGRKTWMVCTMKCHLNMHAWIKPLNFLQKYSDPVEHASIFWTWFCYS